MTDKNQNNSFDDDQPLSDKPISDEPLSDEYLSAYVDGELTDEQLAQVEQRLAADPQARQLVEELRSLSQAVQALPREAIGADLRSTIMQRAERTMLLGHEGQGTLGQGTLPPGEAGSSRRWLWAAMALAATLLLSVYLPNARQEEKPLASAKPVPGEASQPEMRLESAETDLVAGAVDEEMRETEREAELTADIEATNPSVAEIASDEGVAVSDDSFAASGIEADRVAAARSPALTVPTGGAAATAAEPAIDPKMFMCQVNVTCNAGEKSFEQFDRVLAKNSIEIDAIPTASQSKESSQQGVAGRRRQSRLLADKQQVVQEEVFEIDAPIELIENTLVDLYDDTSNFAGLELIEQQPQQSATNQLQQYARKSAKPIANKLSKSLLTRKKTNLSQQGRALRVDANQYQGALGGEYGGLDDQARSGQKGFGRGYGQAAQAKSSSNDQSQANIKVLFVLQQTIGESSSAVDEENAEGFKAESSKAETPTER